MIKINKNDVTLIELGFKRTNDPMHHHNYFYNYSITPNSISVFHLDKEKHPSLIKDININEEEHKKLFSNFIDSINKYIASPLFKEFNSINARMGAIYSFIIYLKDGTIYRFHHRMNDPKNHNLKQVFSKIVKEFVPITFEE